ncbi:MAG TPA: hypothetical protein VJ476_09170 [Rhizomicrobium sp.]|nr:hypothetical protein [Rhizomicrobium sp.]
MRIHAILAVFPLLLAFAAPTYARGTLDSILPQIRAQHPGRLSDAEPWTDADGNAHYRIKWMTPEGRILYFDADTRTGRYSGAGGDEANQWRNRHFEQGAGRWNGDQDNRRDRGDQNNGGGRDHWNGDAGGDWHGRGDQGGHGRNFGGWHGGGNGGGNGGNHHHGH